MPASSQPFPSEKVGESQQGYLVWIQSRMASSTAFFRSPFLPSNRFIISLRSSFINSSGTSTLSCAIKDRCLKFVVSWLYSYLGISKLYNYKNSNVVITGAKK